MSILDNNHDKMKKYCTKLGVAEMYGLLVCMVAGRTWDSVQDGIATKKLTDAEVIQNNKSIYKKIIIMFVFISFYRKKNFKVEFHWC